ncbi:UNVERIFIED_CONTAM: hypothetical protein GTU68_037582 [Idotea baltica]|nr:hypothetical protein [Idotea baltica]
MALKKGLRIGRISQRTGLSISAIRFYEEQGLVQSERNATGQRVFQQSDIRKLSFVMIAQNLGFSLREIAQALARLPDNRAPTLKDWEKLAGQFETVLEQRINALQTLRDKLTGCIGCGCLSLDRCALYNAQDRAAALGTGPRYLLGDHPDQP